MRTRWVIFKRLPVAAAMLIMLVMALAAAEPAASATDQLDQSSVMTWYGEATGVNADQLIAQTFTAGLTGCLTRVDLAIWVQDGNPGMLSAQLVSLDASSGAPTGPVLAQTTLLQRAVPVGQPATNALPAPLTTATFAAPAAVVAGGQYGILLTSANGNGAPVPVPGAGGATPTPQTGGATPTLQHAQVAPSSVRVRPSATGSATGGAYYWAYTESPPTAQTGGYPAVIDGYPGGTLWVNSLSYNGGTWAPDPSNGAVQFQTYVGPCPNPAPTLTSLSPNAVLVGATLPLNVTGIGFTPTSYVQWNGGPLATTFVSSTQLTTTIPLSTAAGTADVAVFTPAPGGGQSMSLPVFITAATTSVSSIGTATSSAGGTATTSAGGASGTTGSTSVAATGSGTVTVAQYSQDPVTTPNPSGTSSYFDVYVPQTSSFSSLSIVDCTGNGQLVSWWDQAANNGAGARVQIPLADQQANTPPGCTTVTLSPTSSPSTFQLSGTPFAAAKVTAASLKALIGQAVADTGVAHSLQAKVDSIASAPTPNAKAGKLEAFTNEVHARTGKALTARQAATLIQLAGAL